MRAQIAITRNGITQASSDKSPPEGGVLARRTNGDFLISLHRHVSETALVQMMRSLRALDPGFEMSLEMAGNITRHLSRQDTCLRLALRALGILERVNEPLFMSNLEIYDRKRPPTGMLSQNLLKLAELDLAGKDAPTALLEVSAAAIENLVSVGQVHAAVFPCSARGDRLAGGGAGHRRSPRRRVRLAGRTMAFHHL